MCSYDPSKEMQESVLIRNCEKDNFKSDIKLNYLRIKAYLNVMTLKPFCRIKFNIIDSRFVEHFFSGENSFCLDDYYQDSQDKFKICEDNLMSFKRYTCLDI